MFLEDIARVMRRHKVDYALVGGYAVALHGAVRGTVDVDLVVRLDQSSLKNAEAALNELGLQSRLPVSAEDIMRFREEYIQKRNMAAWSFINPDNPTEVVDIIITDDLAHLATVTKKLFGIKFPVLELNALIEMKRRSGRPQDIEDIKALEKLR